MQERTRTFQKVNAKWSRLASATRDGDEASRVRSGGTALTTSPSGDDQNQQQKHKTAYTSRRYSTVPVGTFNSVLSHSFLFCLTVSITARQALQYSSGKVKESERDLDRGRASLNGKPCKIAVYYCLRQKQERRSARARTTSQLCIHRWLHSENSLLQSGVRILLPLWPQNRESP